LKCKVNNLISFIQSIKHFLANFGGRNQKKIVLEDKKTNNYSRIKDGFMGKHPILANIIIIVLIAIIGVWIAHLSIAIFTKHGESDIVPKVENMSYTEAIDKLHDAGFRTEIRDSLYKENVRPGFVIEQFPKANSIVKPGRKIFLYINAVHPKEVVIDDDNHPNEDALKSFSVRQGLARLEELGFKKVKVIKVLGDNDCIIKITANGRTVKKTQKVAVNTLLVVHVSDGRLSEVRDSLQNSEYVRYVTDENYNADENYDEYSNTEEYQEEESFDYAQ
jgi:hypothetical protein